MDVSYFNGLKLGFKNNWYKIPNLLTELRLIASPLPGILLLIWSNNFNNRIAIALLFAVLAMTDMLDGFFARVLKQNTEYGRLLDPIADAFFGTLTLMALSSVSDLALIILIMSILRQLVIVFVAKSMKKRGKMIAVTKSGKVKTVMQLVATLVLLLPNQIVSESVQIVVTSMAALMILLSLDSYVRQNN